MNYKLLIVVLPAVILAQNINGDQPGLLDQSLQQLQNQFSKLQGQYDALQDRFSKLVQQPLADIPNGGVLSRLRRRLQSLLTNLSSYSLVIGGSPVSIDEKKPSS